MQHITSVYAKQVEKTCDYIVVYTGWMKTQEKYLTKEEMLAWACWEEISHPNDFIGSTFATK